MKSGKMQLMTGNQRGVTLIELLMGMFMFVTIIASVAVFFNYLFDSYYFAFESGKTVDEIKFVMDKITSELREMDTSEEGAYALAVANDQELVFYADSDDDDEVELIRYFLEGTSLKRGTIAPGDPSDWYGGAEEITTMSEFVQNGGEPIFSYYNGDWPGDEINNPLPSGDRLASTRLIRIDLKVNTSPGTLADVRTVSQVMLRNLKTNY